MHREKARGGVGLTMLGRIRVAAAFTRAGNDFFSVVRGRADTEIELAKAIPPMGTPAAPHLEFAGWVRKRVDVPVMHAGRIADVAIARHAVGHADHVRPCGGASVRLDSIYTSGSAVCIHNPATGREPALPPRVVRSARTDSRPWCRSRSTSGRSTCRTCSASGRSR